MGPVGQRVRIAAWIGAAVLLLVPLAAMQFTDEVAWTLSDFAVFAILLAGTLAAFEFVLRRTADRFYRIAAGTALAAGFLLVWINGAVGIVGSESNPLNRVYAAVIAVALIGALLARFRPRGMAIAMRVAAAAQVTATGVALSRSLGPGSDVSVGAPVALTSIIVALWLVSAWLFARSATRSS